VIFLASFVFQEWAINDDERLGGVTKLVEGVSRRLGWREKGELVSLGPTSIRIRGRLGGLLKFYSREAAGVV
jgi:hypothetical protein